MINIIAKTKPMTTSVFFRVISRSLINYFFDSRIPVTMATIAATLSSATLECLLISFLLPLSD